MKSMTITVLSFIVGVGLCLMFPFVWVREHAAQITGMGQFHRRQPPTSTN